MRETGIERLNDALLVLVFALETISSWSFGNQKQTSQGLDVMADKIKDTVKDTVNETVKDTVKDTNTNGGGGKEIANQQHDLSMPGNITIGFFITNPDQVRQGVDGAFVDGRWSPRGGETFPPGKKMLFRGMVRCVRGWLNSKLLGEYIETREKLPNVSKLNAEIPEDEWDISDFDNKPRKPYAHNWAVYLVDETDGATYTFCNSTYGQMLAYDELLAKLAIDAAKGIHGIPVIELSSKPMKAAKGTTTKLRPFFKVLPDYLNFGGDPPPVVAEEQKKIDFDDKIGV
jgi:hypothetical protein